MIEKIKSIGKKTAYSLRARMFLVIIIGAMLATLVYISVRFVMVATVDARLATDSARAEREREYILRLQAFVDANNISSSDMEKIEEWASHDSYTYIMLYMDDKLFFSGGFGETSDMNIPLIPGMSVAFPTIEEIREYAAKNDLHTVTLADDTMLASVGDFSEYLYYDMANMISLIAAFVVLSLVMMSYFFGITRRIATLSRDVMIVSEVNMNHSIHTDGNDELSGLSRNVERMRSSILENIEKEKEALDANTELITSMSHDIRTPLTVLLGYIDLMKARADDEIMQEYLKVSETTALRLKELSDDMFRYFLVFGNGEIDIDIQSYNASTLLEQLLSEHLLLLSENGYSVASFGDWDFEPGALIKTDAPKAMRIFDNIFSNIYKYADQSAPIEFSIVKSDNTATISIKNKINKNRDKSESTGIGLKTCKKIAESVGLAFEYGTCAEYFEAVVSFKHYREELDQC